MDLKNPMFIQMTQKDLYGNLKMKNFKIRKDL